MMTPTVILSWQSSKSYNSYVPGHLKTKTNDIIEAYWGFFFCCFVFRTRTCNWFANRIATDEALNTWVPNYSRVSMVKNFSFNVKGNSEPVKWCNFLLKGKLMHFGLTISMPQKIKKKKKIHKQTQKNLPSFFTVFIRCQWCLTHFKKHLIHWFLSFRQLDCVCEKYLRDHILIAFIQHPFFRQAQFNLEAPCFMISSNRKCQRSGPARSAEVCPDKTFSFFCPSFFPTMKRLQRHSLRADGWWKKKHARRSIDPIISLLTSTLFTEPSRDKECRGVPREV